MNGLCNSDNVVYQAIIYPKENINDKKCYIGISSTNFKIRYGNHKFSFSHEHQKNQTALSKHYWRLKVKGLTRKYNGPYWKDLVPQNLSKVGATCVLKKKSTFCFFLSQKNY